MPVVSSILHVRRSQQHPREICNQHSGAEVQYSSKARTKLVGNSSLNQGGGGGPPSHQAAVGTQAELTELIMQHDHIMQCFIHYP